MALSYSPRNSQAFIFYIMPFQCRKQSIRFCIPYLYSRVLTSGGKKVTTIGKGESKNSFLMTYTRPLVRRRGRQCRLSFFGVEEICSKCQEKGLCTIHHVAWIQERSILLSESLSNPVVVVVLQVVH